MGTNGKNMCQFTNWIPAAKNPAALVTVARPDIIVQKYSLLIDLTLLI